MWDAASAAVGGSRMHLVLDLQACQSPESRRRGIGRFSLALAKAIAGQPRNHEVTILLNAAMGDSVEDMRAQFEGLVPQSRIRTWSSIAPTARAYPENRFRQRASEALRLQVLRKLKPDVVHVASLFEGMADDVTASVPAAVEYPTAVTLYDLIPLAHAETYLDRAVVREWYMEKIGFLRHSQLLLGISSFACMEARELLGMTTGVVNISGAADSIFQPLPLPEEARAALAARYGLQKPFIMYAGGFDPRKNIAGLIRAFALLPSEVRAGRQLAIVGGAPEPERQKLVEQMATAGVQPDEVVFTGYVSDADLVKLYNLCELYVFPSLQEGFGLPALEAMSCGAVVIGSDTSSLPEVIGREDALFDPRDDRAIAHKMWQALADPEFRTSMREHARVQPKKFSWTESARRALDAFEGARELHKSGAVVVSKSRKRRAQRTAYLPAPSPGVGTRFPKAKVFADPDCEGTPASKRRSLERFRLQRERWDRVVIELADCAYCAKTLALAPAGGADLVLRDHNIGQALAKLAVEAPGLLIEAVYRSGGYPALRSAVDAGLSSAEILGRLVTPEGLAGLEGCQVIRHSGHASPDTISWRDFVAPLLDELMRAEDCGLASEQDWHAIASAISRDLLQGGSSPRWLVDISNLCVRDAGTGIQRVVRSVLDELIANPPADCRIEPVYLDDDGVFRYARSYCARRYFPGLVLPADEPVEFAESDVFLGLDLIAHKVPAFIGRFRELRNRGIRQYYVVYDLLPLLRPDCFEPHLLPLFRAWYEAVSEVADGLVCISRSVADQLSQWLDQARPLRQRPLRIGYFHLGADLSAGPDAAEEVGLPAGMGTRPTLLMVGTIEPRKGHVQGLRAFESLWDKGIEVNLLIIGRPGWLSEDTIQSLRVHPELGNRLWWFEDADDTLLRAAYRGASALLMASEGEGYGLPLIEAAHHDLPLIARDLPVFREVAGEHAFYFSGFGADDLARAIESWLHLHHRNMAPRPEGIRRLTWAEACAQLVQVVRDENWVRDWTPGPLRRHAASDYRLESEVGRLLRGRLHTTGRSGFLVHGLSWALPAGRYRVRILGGWDEIGGSAWVGVAVGDSSVPAVRKSLEPRITDSPETLAELELQLAASVTDYQIRVFVDAQAALWVEEILIEAEGGAISDNARPGPYPREMDGAAPPAPQGETDSNKGRISA